MQDQFRARREPIENKGSFEIYAMLESEVKICVRPKFLMNTVTFDQALDVINKLPFEQQEMLIDIFRKRLVEKRRQQIAQDAQESLNAFRQGQFTAQSAEQIIRELNESYNEDSE